MLLPLLLLPVTGLLLLLFLYDSARLHVTLLRLLPLFRLLQLFLRVSAYLPVLVRLRSALLRLLHLLVHVMRLENLLIG